MFYVYILFSPKDKYLYTGFTRNLKRRIQEHKRGENISTKQRLSISIIFYEGYLSKIDALRRERYFKTTKGKAVLKSMLKHTLSKVTNT